MRLVAKDAVIPLHALLAPGPKLSPNPELPVVQMFQEAEIIVGVNAMDGHEFLVFGRDILEAIASRAAEEREVPILAVEIDQETDELEMLIAIVRGIKGRDCY